MKNMATYSTPSEKEEEIRARLDQSEALLVSVCQKLETMSEKRRSAVIAVGDDVHVAPAIIGLGDVPGLSRWWEKQKPIVERVQRRREAERKRAEAAAELAQLDREEHGG